jgi:hypothetical protein
MNAFSGKHLKIISHKKNNRFDKQFLDLNLDMEIRDIENLSN